MEHRISLRCRCGTLRGTLQADAADGNHGLCYCDDCQTYAHYLGRADILDDWGGTQVFQAMPSRMELTEGASELRCLRLSPKGLHRWYAGCCNTPLGNTMGPRAPFVGVPLCAMELQGRDPEQLLGKTVRVQGKFAQGKPPGDVPDKYRLRDVLKIAYLMASWSLRKGGQPNPFFDAQGKPRVAPRIIPQDERVALRRQVSPQT